MHASSTGRPHRLPDATCTGDSALLPQCTFDFIPMQVASFYVARASPPTAQAKWSAAYTEPPAYLPPRQYQWRRGGGACVRTRVRFPLPARACDVVVTPPRGPGAPCTGAPMLAWGSSRRTSIQLSLARYILGTRPRAFRTMPFEHASPVRRLWTYLHIYARPRRAIGVQAGWARRVRHFCAYGPVPSFGRSAPFTDRRALVSIDCERASCATLAALRRRQRRWRVLWSTPRHCHRFIFIFTFLRPVGAKTIFGLGPTALFAFS